MHNIKVAAIEWKYTHNSSNWNWIKWTDLHSDWIESLNHIRLRWHCWITFYIHLYTHESEPNVVRERISRHCWCCVGTYKKRGRKNTRTHFKWQEPSTEFYTQEQERRRRTTMRKKSIATAAYTKHTHHSTFSVHSHKHSFTHTYTFTLTRTHSKQYFFSLAWIYFIIIFFLRFQLL